MHPFQYHQPQTLEEAATLLTDAQDGAAHIIAGGSDLIDEIKEGIVSPASLVSLASVPGLAGIVESGAGLRIGAMTTIADVAAHPVIRAAYTSLAEAAGGLATPQIRNVGTLGGNLNQRPRCWYYRHPLTQCLKKGGDRCFALIGNTKYLCVTGGDRCYIVHPSDTAVALSVFDASIEISGGGGSRTLPNGDFFAGPGVDVLRETVLEPGEVVSGVTLPRRPIWAPTASHPAACTSRLGNGRPATSPSSAWPCAWPCPAESSSRRRWPGGVAPVPYRAMQVEEYLAGRSVSEVDAAHAGASPSPTPAHDRQRLQGDYGQQPREARHCKVAGGVVYAAFDCMNSFCRGGR